MSCRIAVLDDVPADADYVAALAAGWGARVEKFSSAEAFLFRWAEEKSFDILLFDIEMPGMDGVTLARRVRGENRDAQIVFVTGYTDYILDGYEVEALHYLLKPVTREKLFAVLDRAAERLRRNGRALTIDLGGETARVPLSEIRYVEVMRNYVTIHAREDYTAKRTLAEIEAALDGDFFRVGRSHVLNLRFVRRVSREAALLEGGASVPLARGSYEKLNRALIERL